MGAEFLYKKLCYICFKNFVPEPVSSMCTDSPEDIQKCRNEKVGSQQNWGRLCMRTPSENSVANKSVKLLGGTAQSESPL